MKFSCPVFILLLGVLFCTEHQQVSAKLVRGEMAEPNDDVLSVNDRQLHSEDHEGMKKKKKMLEGIKGKKKGGAGRKWKRNGEKKAEWASLREKIRSHGDFIGKVGENHHEHQDYGVRENVARRKFLNKKGGKELHGYEEEEVLENYPPELLEEYPNARKFMNNHPDFIENNPQFLSRFPKKQGGNHLEHQEMMLKRNGGKKGLVGENFARRKFLNKKGGKELHGYAEEEEVLENYPPELLEEYPNARKFMNNHPDFIENNPQFLSRFPKKQGGNHLEHQEMMLLKRNGGKKGLVGENFARHNKFLNKKGGKELHGYEEEEEVLENYPEILEEYPNARKFIQNHPDFIENNPEFLSRFQKKHNNHLH